MLVDAAEEEVLREGFEHGSVEGLRYENGIFRQSLELCGSHFLRAEIRRNRDPIRK
jgi:hypothetical protein